MKKIEIEVNTTDLINSYLELKSSYKVAKKFNTSATSVKRVLKELGVLRTQNAAAKERGTYPLYKRTNKHREKLSTLAKMRSGKNHPCFGKAKTESTKYKISEKAKLRYGEKNSNFKHGLYERRTRDFKIVEFKPIRNFVFNRDNYSCHYCEQKGNHLHAHHRIPYWVKPEAFLDIDNIITTCTKCHFEKAHIGNWQKFDIKLITDLLISKYSLDRERLNELAALWADAIVRSSDIHKTEESDRNTQTV